MAPLQSGKLFEKAFSLAHAEIHRRRDDVVSNTGASVSSLAVPQEGPQDVLTRESADASSLLPRTILRAHRASNPFDALGIATPVVDDVTGEATWTITDAEISKAYRERARAVHPDKNPSEEARDAFQALKECSRMLRQPEERDAAVRAYADKYRAEVKQKGGYDHAAAAAGDVSAMPEVLRARAQRVNEHQAAQASAFHADIVAQVNAQRERARQLAKRKRERLQAQEENDDDDGDDDAPSARPRVDTAGAQTHVRDGDDEDGSAVVHVARASGSSLRGSVARPAGVRAGVGANRRRAL